MTIIKTLLLSSILLGLLGTQACAGWQDQLGGVLEGVHKLQTS